MGNGVSTDLWDKLLDRPLLFKHKDAMRHSYLPKQLLHRDDELAQLGKILVDVLKGNTPDNIYLFGKTGTGKSVSVRRTVEDLKVTASNRGLDSKIVPVWVLGTVMSETGVYQAIGEGINAHLGTQVSFSKQHGADQLTNRIVALAKQQPIHLMVVFDEIDKLVNRSGDDVINWVSRLKADYDIADSTVSFIGISNDVSFIQRTSAKLKSAQSSQLLVFPPYNALQLNDILKDRVNIAVKENVVSEQAIGLAAAMSAQENGDARLALDLMRKAVEIAEMEKHTIVDEKLIYLAHSTLETDAIKEVMQKLTLHQKIIVWAVYLIDKQIDTHSNPITTGDIFSIYQKICKSTDTSPLTQRRMADLMREVAMMGIIDARVKSFGGRMGRTTTVRLQVSQDDVENAYSDEWFTDFKMPRNHRILA